MPPTPANGKVCYIEVPAVDVHRSADFYAKVVASGLFRGSQLSLLKEIASAEVQHVDALTATVKKLGAAARKEELARMLGGTASARARAHAAEMLEDARRA